MDDGPTIQAEPSHPAAELVVRCAEGTAQTTEILLVDAHVDACWSCQAVYRQASLPLTLPVAPKAASDAGRDLDVLARTLAAIDAASGNNASGSPRTAGSPSLETFHWLPPSLRHLKLQAPGWRWQSFWPSRGKVAEIARDASGGYRLYLGCLEPGAVLPAHQHKYPEQVVVLAGRYLSGGKEYGPGRWIEQTVGDGHAPAAGPEDACYCLIRSHWWGMRFTGLSSWRNLFVPFIA